MNNNYLFAVFFITSFSFGWFANSWWSTKNSLSEQVASQSINTKGNTLSNSQSIKLPIRQSSYPQKNTNNETSAKSGYISNDDVSDDQQLSAISSVSDETLSSMFDRLLWAHRYDDAMLIYQEQYEAGNDNSVLLKQRILMRLQSLLKNNDKNNFSELTDSFLSSYYDDIDILLLLAEFNQVNGLYIEASNVYQLAKSYAYEDALAQKVLDKFYDFVETIDSYYASNNDWSSLVNLYAHIEALGLLNSSYQYRQAIIYHKNGDDYFAIEQLTRLEADDVVGDQATAALKKLMGDEASGRIVQTNPWANASAIALQQNGNQYLVDLGVNAKDEVRLLIDTGASLTTLSRTSFLALTRDADVSEVGSRLFQTANGVTKGSVYLFPELTLGPYVLQNIQIAVLDFTLSAGIDGLLGMNVLGQFRFQIDQDNIQLLLTKK